MKADQICHAAESLSCLWLQNTCVWSHPLATQTHDWQLHHPIIYVQWAESGTVRQQLLVHDYVGQFLSGLRAWSSTQHL